METVEKTLVEKIFSVAAHTFGCKVNQWDTNNILSQLADIGVEVLTPTQLKTQSPSLFIINTCTVTAISEKKCITLIQRVKRDNPATKIAICGCMTKLNKNIPLDFTPDFIFDAREPADFIAYVSTLHTPTAPTLFTTTKTRGFVKIQDGCNRFCSYCIVPYARGGPKSRPMAEILEEIHQHISKGVLEIIITGIQIAAYGQEYGQEHDLASLLESILQAIPPTVRIRLSSIEPQGVTPHLLQLFSHYPNLCSHIHLALQSGSAKILQAMNRHYNPSQYKNTVTALRQARPDIAITTDMIVGFPGESDEDFADTLQFVDDIQFAGIHVFIFSPREGTKAATMADHISPSIASARAATLRHAAKTMEENFYKQHIGHTMEVLFESPLKDASNQYKGYTSTYCATMVSSPTNISGTIRRVPITGYKDNHLITAPTNNF